MLAAFERARAQAAATAGGGTNRPAAAAGPSARSTPASTNGADQMVKTKAPPGSKKMMRRMLKRLPPYMPVKEGPYGELPPRKRLKAFFERTLDRDDRPGTGNTICANCFVYIPIRKFICPHCELPNPSSRNSTGFHKGAGGGGGKGKADKDEK